MAARVTQYAESLTESTTTSSTYQDKVTLTFTPNANKTYMIFYSCFGGYAGTGNSTDVRLQNTTTPATLCNPNRVYKDVTDYVCMSGFAIETFGASPSSQTYKIQYSSSSIATTCKIQNARLIALELGANDFTATAAGPTTITDTNYVTGVTMTQTFVNAADYYIFANCEMGTTNVSARIEVNALYDGGTAYGDCDHDMVNASDFIPWCTVFKITGDGTSNPLIIRGRSSSTVDVKFQRLSIVAVKATDFDALFYDASATRITSTSATYGDGLTGTHTPANLEHLVFFSGILDGNSTTNSFYTQALEGATVLGEHLHETSTAAEGGGAMSYCVGYRKTLAASSTVWKNQYKVENAGDTAGLKEQTILLLQTAASPSTLLVRPWNINQAVNRAGTY